LKTIYLPEETLSWLSELSKRSNAKVIPPAHAYDNELNVDYRRRRNVSLQANGRLLPLRRTVTPS
jgi:hypothetical protein